MRHVKLINPTDSDLVYVTEATLVPSTCGSDKLTVILNSGTGLRVEGMTQELWIHRNFQFREWALDCAVPFPDEDEPHKVNVEWLRRSLQNLDDGVVATVEGAQ